MRRCRGLAAAGIAAAVLLTPLTGAGPAAAQGGGPPRPILEYRFNEGAGTQALNSGTLADGGAGEQGHLNLRTATGAATNLLWGAPGSGISGEPGDRALSLLDATGMGSVPAGATGPYGDAGDLNATDGLRSLTVSGWFRVPAGGQAPGNFARLIGDNTGSAGFALSLTGGQMQFRLDGSLVLSPTHPALSAVDEWVFFAATYDGSLGSASVARFFVGTKTTLVTELGSGSTVLQSGLDANTAPLRIGNGSISTSSGNERPFDGLLDNVHVYGAGSGGSGALDLAALRAIYSANVTVIPEPGSASLFALPLAAVLLRRRLRRRGGR